MHAIILHDVNAHYGIVQNVCRIIFYVNVQELSQILILFPQFLMHATLHVNTNVMNKEPSVFATPDMFLLVTNSVVSNVLLLTLPTTLFYLHGILLYVITVTLICHLYAVEQ